MLNLQLNKSIQYSFLKTLYNMAVNYKDLGLVNTREMFKRAIDGGWAVPAFNFNNLEQLQAIITASSQTKSPVILQVSKGARKYANQTLLRYLAEGAVEYAKELGCNHPEIVLHLDHGDSFETCKSCVDFGFSSVMIDGSSLPYEENVALTKKVVEYAHQFDVTVEGELGVLAGVEDDVVAEESHYTRPEEVVDFAKRTGCDSLAISIGTSHGAYKFTPEQCTRDPKTGKLVPPPLAFDVLEAVEKELPGFPIVLHGSSSVPEKYKSEKSEQKESDLSGKSTFRPAFGQGSESERHFWKWQFQDLKYSKTGRVRRKGKLTDKFRPVLLQRYGLRKYGKRIRERGLQDRQM